MDNNTPIMNTKLLTYDIKIPKYIRNKIRNTKYKDKVVLGVIVTNLLACVRKEQKLVYSRDKRNTKVGKRSLSAHKIISAVDFLEKEGYIVNNIGIPHIGREKRVVSYIIPTDKFLSEFIKYNESSNIIPICEDEWISTYPTIELRDSSKRPIPFKLTKEVVVMQEFVKELNKLNEEAVVKDHNGNILTNNYCRVFNESFEYGGRFYRADVLHIKNKYTHHRHSITINGDPVVEIDYGNLHFRIAAVLERIPMYCTDIPHDVYSYILEDEDNPVDREIIKTAVNIMFNSDDRHKAELAIRSVINKLSPEEKAIYSLGGSRAVVLMIEDVYPEFSHLFCREEGYGRILQKEESELAVEVLKVFVDKGYPILPVHDSFIVQQQHENLLVDTMAQSFCKRYGVEVSVPLTISYMVDGKLHKDKILGDGRDYGRN